MTGQKISPFLGDAGLLCLNIEELNRASKLVLDAAIEPHLWNTALDRIGEAVGAFGGNIMQPLGGAALFAPHATESVQACLDEYNADGWNLRDFRANFIPQMMRLGVAVDRHYATTDVMINHEYYRFLDKYRMKHAAVISFTAGKNPLFFVLQRKSDKAPFSDEEIVVLQGLRTRLDMAGAIANAVEGAHVEGMAEAFEMSRVGCVFFNVMGAVTHMNASAESLMRRGISIRRGELRGENHADSEVLRRAVSDAVRGRRYSSSVILLRRRAARPLIVRVNGSKETWQEHSAIPQPWRLSRNRK